MKTLIKRSNLHSSKIINFTFNLHFILSNFLINFNLRHFTLKKVILRKISMFHFFMEGFEKYLQF